jgi:hypothetical protein
MSEENPETKDLEKKPETANGEAPASVEEQKETVTIMPTMIDDSEQGVEKKRDLSAIIPKFDDLSENEDALQLNSVDNELKSDGAITIGTINVEGEVTVSPNKELPVPIDIEQRKKERANNKTLHRREKKKKVVNKNAQKFQNTTSLVALLLIVGLAGFFYWIKTRPTEKDFTPLTVKVELGDGELPIEPSNYVKPGIGTYVDGLEYVIDTGDVNLNEVGEYKFSVTYKGITKYGKILVKDETPPKLEVTSVTIVEGSTITPGDFAASCFDYSGCNYSFQDADTEAMAQTAGSYVIFITATDAYKNTTTKQAGLTVEASGATKKYSKKTGFDFNTGYEVEETYELHFAAYSTRSTLSRGIYKKVLKFQAEEKYQASRKIYNGESGYSCDDAALTITFTQTVTTVGSNYSDLNDIENYLGREGYTSY